MRRQIMAIVAIVAIAVAGLTGCATINSTPTGTGSTQSAVALTDMPDYTSPAQKGENPSVAFSQCWDGSSWKRKRSFYQGLTAQTLGENPMNEEMKRHYELLLSTPPAMKNPGKYATTNYARWELCGQEWSLIEGTPLTSAVSAPASTRGEDLAQGNLTKRLPDYQDYYSQEVKPGNQPAMAYKQVWNPYLRKWMVQRSFYNGANPSTLTKNPTTAEMNDYWERLHTTTPQVANPSNWAPSYYALWCLTSQGWELCEGGGALGATTATADLGRTIGVTVTQTDAGTLISCNDRVITFDFNSAKLKSSSYPVLGKVLAYLLTESGKVQVIGHTDPKGEKAYNLDLSKRRAQAVADWLISSNIKADRITVIGKGKSELIKDAPDSEQRRVEFLVSK